MSFCNFRHQNWFNPVWKQFVINISTWGTHKLSMLRWWEAKMNCQIWNNRLCLDNHHWVDLPSCHSNATQEWDVWFTSRREIYLQTWRSRHNLQLLCVSLAVQTCFINIENQSWMCSSNLLLQTFCIIMELCICNFSMRVFKWFKT